MPSPEAQFSGGAYPSGLPDFEYSGVTLVAPARPTATLAPAALLFITDHRQNRPQPLVVSDGGLIDVANLVEGAVAEFDAVVADRKPAIGVIENGYVFADCRFIRLARLQYKDHVVVLQCQRLRETALFFPRKSVLEIVARAQRPVQVLLILFAGGLAKRACNRP